MENQEKKVSVINLIGVIAGIIMVIYGCAELGTAVNTTYYSTSPDNVTFGADFYTDTYEGIREVDDNVNHLRGDVGKLDNDMIESTRYLLIAMGICLIFVCGSNMERYEQNERLITALGSGTVNAAPSEPGTPGNNINTNILPPM